MTTYNSRVASGSTSLQGLSDFHLEVPSNGPAQTKYPNKPPGFRVLANDGFDREEVLGYGPLRGSNSLMHYTGEPAVEIIPCGLALLHKRVRERSFGQNSTNTLSQFQASAQAVLPGRNCILIEVRDRGQGSRSGSRYTNQHKDGDIGLAYSKLASKYWRFQELIVWQFLFDPFLVTSVAADETSRSFHRIDRWPKSEIESSSSAVHGLRLRVESEEPGQTCLGNAVTDKHPEIFARGGRHIPT
ncbi:hypothetical protein CONLIGDRAFT_640823 [Coniochaeta ligniaria NRRL 30616]|uniref:Uncharacterized protein n=1 Tax=Coniochaeta ligniaria NRRL 30616 TaxID=1408157 RepID=A0A1J7J2M9_9PEZI|nr:hypothetical protein CONLIGDRAFT_640823 [Coniochaeta ligniaria NRRL 30616]